MNNKQRFVIALLAGLLPLVFYILVVDVEFLQALYKQAQNDLSSSTMMLAGYGLKLVLCLSLGVIGGFLFKHELQSVSLFRQSLLLPLLFVFGSSLWQVNSNRAHMHNPSIDQAQSKSFLNGFLAHFPVAAVEPNKALAAVVEPVAVVGMVDQTQLQAMEFELETKQTKIDELNTDISRLEQTISELQHSQLTAENVAKFKLAKFESEVSRLQAFESSARERATQLNKVRNHYKKLKTDFLQYKQTHDVKDKENELMLKAAEFHIDQLTARINSLNNQTIVEKTRKQSLSTVSMNSGMQAKSIKNKAQLGLEAELAALNRKWAAYNERLFPELVDEVIEGVSLYTLDTVSSECVTRFFENQIDNDCIRTLSQAVEALNRVMLNLTGDAKNYFTELQQITQNVISVNRQMQLLGQSRLTNLD